VQTPVGGTPDVGRTTDRLQARNLSSGTKLVDVSFGLRPGEVLGVVALEGQGQDELFGILSGSIRPSGGSLVVDGRELYLALATTPLPGSEGRSGLAVVLDDVTPLIRAQKVAAWRDVARRLAHEVKNPLTPIQLCAERLKRHFGGAPAPTRQLVDECSSTIIQEVESLKLLVDEFSQFARMPAPRTVPSDLNALIVDALSLYKGLFERIRIEPRLAPDLPAVRVDPEQFRRVIINLVDNAVEAINAPATGLEADDGLVTVETSHDPSNGVVRVVVGDDGQGISEADRARLFLPYYSTKQRGSGLGLAIVRRIVVEHGGSIEASDNHPHGTRTTIELPC